jgi:hypothetical protein
MSGVYQLEIKETPEELKKLLAIQKTASSKERVQLLYLLKTGQGQTISQIQRGEFWQMMQTLLVQDLIFIDETGVALALTRL